MNTPTETDILRLCVALGQARDDEDTVKAIIDTHLTRYPAGVHAALLQVTLRVVVAQFWAPAAARLDQELGMDWTDLCLDYQAAANDGLVRQGGPKPGGPHLAAVSDN